MAVAWYDHVQRATHLLVQSMCMDVRVAVVGDDATAQTDSILRVTDIVNSVALRNDGTALVIMKGGARILVNMSSCVSVILPDDRAHSQRDPAKLAGWGDWLWGR